MRSFVSVSALVAAGIALLIGWSDAFALDYESRYIRSYPPGFHGMFYNAERFFELRPAGARPQEDYRWDEFMSKTTEVYFPFYPIPYDWEYGSTRCFNLPDYNRNDWP